MASIIGEISFFTSDYLYIQNDSRRNFLGNVKKVNFFVGENNSGKSRLMRQILNNQLIYSKQGFPLDSVNKAIVNIKTRITENGFNSSRYSTVNNALSKLKPYDRKDSDSIDCKNLIELQSALEELGGEPYSIGNRKKLFFDNCWNIINEELPKVSGTSIFDHPVFEFKKVYIPILRGLRNLSPNSIESGDRIDAYEERTKSDYFSETNEKIEIFSGLQAYELIKKFLLGNLQKRETIHDFEKYLSKNFFEEKQIALIPSYGSEVLTIKIGDEAERPIFELGDGIQSIIILTLPIFLYKDENVLFFVEEPEILMHPGFQRKYLEVLLHDDVTNKHQFFFTTHSNHFLDISLDFEDISIYILKKCFNEKESSERVPNFQIENISSGDTSVLDALGVRNSSVFLSNCTIWVEGITDRLYIKHYLKLLYKEKKEQNLSEYVEDFNYAFIEYSGSNIKHWSFDEKTPEENICANSISNRIFLIADKDGKIKTHHEVLNETLKKNFYLLPCREIENLLDSDVIRQVVTEYEKNEIQTKFVRSEYKDKLLGKYIDEKLGDDRKRNSSYADKSGTIKGKKEFCIKAISKMNNWSDLSKDAKKLTEMVFDFIQKNNS
jgi:predicted ATP-dependent endonuclease of OLD family